MASVPPSWLMVAINKNMILYYELLSYVQYTQHHSFYDFIVNKARGKSGPLFSFDVHEDVRLIGDASVEKDEVYIIHVYIRIQAGGVL